MGRHEMTRADVLTHALDIAGEYEDQGLNLTLRQMYYQFVSRGLAESGQHVYKRIGDILTDARYSGAFPVNGLEDRGRSVKPGKFTRTTSDIHDALRDAKGIQAALPSFLLRRDRWYGQNTFVSVWVEKEALSGVFEDTCNELGVSWFACKGYPSVSALYDWLKHAHFVCGGIGRDVAPEHTLRPRRRFTMGEGFDWTEEHAGFATQAVVLYFGDHDPDGMEIPQSALRNLGALMRTYDLEIPVTFDRVALNMDQIEKYGPPPFEAKVTSARYRGYVEEHDTEDAWELDALDPSVLRDLVTTSVSGYFNEATFTDNESIVKDLRAELRNRAGLPE